LTLPGCWRNSLGHWWAYVHQTNVKSKPHTNYQPVSSYLIWNFFCFCFCITAVLDMHAAAVVASIFQVVIVAGRRETLGGYRHLIPVQCPDLSVHSCQGKEGGGILFCFLRVRNFCWVVASGGVYWTLGFWRWLHVYIANVPGKHWET
jgi:hypothetical protein